MSPSKAFRYLRFTAMLPLFSLVGCSYLGMTGHAEDAENPNAPPVAIFFTENKDVRAGEVLCDGKTVLRLSAPTVFAVQLEPGDHSLGFEQTPFDKARFERGKQYFFIVMAPAGTIILSSRPVFSAMHCNYCGATAGSFRKDLTIGDFKGIPVALFR
jgi:hypothetical protein